MTDRIRSKLDKLTELRTRMLVTDDAIDELITIAFEHHPELVSNHDDLLAERGYNEASIKALEAEIKKDTERHGSTVKGTGAMAVYSMRSSWDSKGLKGYAVAHPELKAFLTEKASVSIRTVKPKENTDETPPTTTKTPSVQGVQEKKGPSLGNLVIEFARGLREQQARS